jgi:hypothetical protein
MSATSLTPMRRVEFGAASIDPGHLLVTFGSSKISHRHRERLAVVYVRQSDPQQVLQHRESRELQYNLVISRFLAPPVVADHRSAPVNALGYLRVMFTAEDLADTLTRLGKRGAKLVGEVVQYEDIYRLCYIRGPEGILIGLAQQLGQQTSRANPMRRKR